MLIRGVISSPVRGVVNSPVLSGGGGVPIPEGYTLVTYQGQLVTFNGKRVLTDGKDLFVEA